MKPSEIYGLSRSRDKKGKVVKRTLNDYVNCLHTQVGSARENMEVYVIEIYDETMKKDNYLCIPEATKKGYAEAYEGDSVNIGFPSSKTRRGKVGHQMCNTLDTGCQQGVVVPINPDGECSRTIKAQYAKSSRGNFDRQDALGATGVADSRYRIRKLTPRECFRLMGVDDADIDKIQAAGISNSQQYKMAGNSIVVDNLCHILRTMFVDKPTKQVKQLTLF